MMVIMCYILSAVEKNKKERIIKTRLDQSNVLDWQVSSILLKT